MIDVKNPFEVKILIVYDNLQAQTASSRAVRTLKEDLEKEIDKIVKDLLALSRKCGKI